MGFLDKAKDLVGKNADKADDAIDKAADVIDDKTGGKHTDKIANATGKALVKLPDGTNQEFSFTTNASGVAQISFNFNF